MDKSLSILQRSPVVRELSLFTATLAGAIAVYAGELPIVLVAAVAVAGLLVLPRHYNDETDEVDE